MRCEPAHYFTVAKARAWRSAIDADPPYQRGGDAWTLAQRQRFIDSLLNGYDVPKLYLHDLRGRHPTKVYAVVDGKQRLNAIWSFLGDEFELADDGADARRPADAAAPRRRPTGRLFSELSPARQAELLGTYLSVVLIRDADEADIDELFARLNDGTPLTAAEARNAIAGRMSALIRDVAAMPGLARLLRFPDARGAHREVAAALLVAEDGRLHGRVGQPDLGPQALDAFVRARRDIDSDVARALRDAVARRVVAAAEHLRPDDPRLASPAGAIEAILRGWPASAATGQSD